MKKAQENVAAKIHASKAKKTLERCNSANVKEELFRKVNNSKPAKANNDLQQNAKATTYSQLQLLRKKANEEQSNKKNLLSKQQPQQMLSSSKSLASLAAVTPESTEEEPIFFNEIAGAVRARVNSYKQPIQSVSPNIIQRKIQVDVTDEEPAKLTFSNEQPIFVRLEGAKPQIVKKQKFLTDQPQIESTKKVFVSMSDLNRDEQVNLQITRHSIIADDGETYEVDEVFGPSTPDDVFFRKTTFPTIVGYIKEGTAGTILTYDQSSKSFESLINRTLELVFQQKSPHAFLSYYVVQGNQILDLLQPIQSKSSQQSSGQLTSQVSQSTVQTQRQDSLEITDKEDGRVEIAGLMTIRVATLKEAQSLIELGVQSIGVRSALTKKNLSQGFAVFEIGKQGNSEILRIVSMQAAADDQTKQTILEIGNLVRAVETVDDLPTKSILAKILKQSWMVKKKNIAVIINPVDSVKNLTDILQTFLTPKKPSTPALSDSTDLSQLAMVMSELERLKHQNALLQSQVKTYQQELSVREKQPEPITAVKIDLTSKPQPTTLKSCFKRSREANRPPKVVAFKLRLLDNDVDLNNSILERVEHNLKYNDDTIFANLDIFKDIGEESQKVHGKKDKFNASSLLAVKFKDLIASEDEESFQDHDRESLSKFNCSEQLLFKVDESSIVKKYDDSLPENKIGEQFGSREEMSMFEIQQDKAKDVPPEKNLSDSNKMFRSLLEEEPSFLDSKRHDKMNIQVDGEPQPFLDELSRIFVVEEAEMTNINDDQQPIQPPAEQADQMGHELQQQSTLILDEEEVGAAQINGEFYHDDTDPNEQRNGSVMPSFDASQIIPIQNEPSVYSPDKPVLFDVAEECKRMPRQEISRVNDSADCNLTRSDRPGQLRPSQVRSQKINEEFKRVTGQRSPPDPKDCDITTKIAYDKPANPKPELQPSQTRTDEILTFSLTNTFSTIQSLSGDLQAIQKTISRRAPKKEKTVGTDYGGFEIAREPQNRSLSLASKEMEARELKKQKNNDANSMRQHSHSVDSQADKDLDIKAFTSDLQGYYQKIHGDIAQLKGILSNVKQKQEMQTNLDEKLFADMSGDSDNAAKQAYGSPTKNSQRAVKAEDALARSQTLIESIKQEIKQQLTRPSANQPPIDKVDQEHSVRVISLLEKLEGELLTSLIGLPKKSDSGLPRLSNQFAEEVVGSQERSPHQVRHMEIQHSSRQKHMNDHEVKKFKQYERRIAKQKLLTQAGPTKVSSDSTPFSPGISSGSAPRQTTKHFKQHSAIGLGTESVADNDMLSLINRLSNPDPQLAGHKAMKKSQDFGLFHQHQRQQTLQQFKESQYSKHPIHKLSGTPELVKKTLSDTTVNITTNSTAFLVDQSSNISQLLLAPLSSAAHDNKGLMIKSSSLSRSQNSHIGQSGQFYPHQSNFVAASLGSSKGLQLMQSEDLKRPPNQMLAKSSINPCPKTKVQAPASFGLRENSITGSNRGHLVRESSDNTLTLIFDSDDEQETLQQTAKQAKSKMLSEIVEDYFNEGNPANSDSKMRHKRQAKGSQQRLPKSNIKKQREEASRSPSKKVDQLSLGTLPAPTDQEFFQQQSFMNDMSILHLFQDPQAVESQNQSHVRRVSSQNSRFSQNSSLFKESKKADMDLPYADPYSKHKDSETKNERKNSSVDTIKTKEQLQSQFSSIFSRPSEQQQQQSPTKPKLNTWAAPPRMKALKSNKHAKGKKASAFEDAGAPIIKEVKEAEASRISDCVVVEDSQDVEENKHNTSKHAMQKYLLQFFLRKADDGKQ